MLLAAGEGRRLRPLTERLPKILVPVHGVPMLDRLRAYLARQGCRQLALNTHHLPDAVRAHLERSALRPVPRLFHEPALLGTGGALVNAADFWGAAPLLVWNGDILAQVQPLALLAAQDAAAQQAAAPQLTARQFTGQQLTLRRAAGAPLAMLAVQERPSDSHLLVDAQGRVCGLDSARRGRHQVLGPALEPVRALAFNGISLLAPALRERLPTGGAFDLIDALLDAIAAGGRVNAFDVGDAFYGTTGSAEQLTALEAALAERPDVLAAWTP